MIRILLADDHALFRQGLRGILECEKDLTVVGEASTGAQTVERARELTPEMILLDLRMPGGGGFETVHQLKRQNPRTKIVVLTAHPEDHYAVRCLRGGADGYVTKAKSSVELIEAIRHVSSGHKYISPALAEQLAFSLQSGNGEHLHGTLSERELEVMRMIVAGKSVSQIASLLGLSVKTVSTYRSRLLRKMHFRDNAQVIRYGLQQGMVEYLAE